MVEDELHIQRAVRAESGDGLLGVEYLHLRVRLDVAGGDNALACGLDIDGLGSGAVEAGDDALHVEHDLRDVLLDAGDGGKLMLHTGYLDAGAGSAGERREKYPAKRVTKCCAVAALQRFDNILAVGTLSGSLDALDTRLFNFDHIVI